MNIYTLKMPIKQIADAIKSVKNLQVKIAVIDAEEKKLGSRQDALKMYGEAGATKYDEAMENFRLQKMKLISSVQETVNTLKQEAIDFVYLQTVPDGNDILGDGAADFALLQEKLISTPEQLAFILSRHDNSAFRIAADNYAKEKGWEDFSFIDLDKPIKEYTEQVFSALYAAAGEPSGLYAMQYTQTPNEYSRIASAYGLQEEFGASGGYSLEKVIAE